MQNLFFPLVLKSQMQEKEQFRGDISSLGFEATCTYTFHFVFVRYDFIRGEVKRM